MITVKADLGQVPEGLTSLLKDDLPFTAALAITRTAQAAQEADRQLVKGVFHLRNDWTRQGIRIKPAKKEDLTAQVYTDTSNRKTGAPDYLLGQQEGYDKVPFAGRHYLAIPTKYLRAIATGVIPDALRPRSLFPSGVTVNEGDNFQGDFRTNVAGKAHRAVGRAIRKSLGSGEYIAFIQRTKGGTPCIFVRHGGIAHKGAQHDAEPWYTLVRSARVPKRFPMEERTREVVQQQFPRIFERAASEVLVNKALGRGLRVKF